MNTKDPEIERLATEVAALTGETNTGAIRVALQERRARLELQGVAPDRERQARAAFTEEF